MIDETSARNFGDFTQKFRVERNICFFAGFYYLCGASLRVETPWYYVSTGSGLNFVNDENPRMRD